MSQIVLTSFDCLGSQPSFDVLWLVVGHVKNLAGPLGS